MTRTLLAAAALLATAGLASASDLVPGSDLATRQAQTVADQSVVDGVTATNVEALYGYPAEDAARADRAAPAGHASVPASAAGASRILVPGSDSF